MLTFRVEKLVPGGYGLARTERGVVLVKGALPGELVRGEPKRKKGALFLEAPEILEAGQDPLLVADQAAGVGEVRRRHRAPLRCRRTSGA